jgi:hypothetical protein
MGKLKYSSIELEIIEQKMRFVIMQKSEEQRRKKTKSSTCIMNLCLILFMCLFCCLIFSFVMLCGSLHAFIETQNLHTHTHSAHNHKCEVEKTVVVMFCVFSLPFCSDRGERGKNKMVEYAFVTFFSLFCIRISSPYMDKNS